MLQNVIIIPAARLHQKTAVHISDVLLFKIILKKSLFFKIKNWIITFCDWLIFGGEKRKNKNKIVKHTI